MVDDEHIRRLSLYPLWLIRDDIFQIFALHFAVSDLVNSLKPEQIGDGLSIHCVVIPQSVVSLYDHNIEYKRPFNKSERETMLESIKGLVNNVNMCRQWQ